MQVFPIWLLLVGLPLTLALFAGLTALVVACALSATFRGRCGRGLRAFAPVILVAVVLIFALRTVRMPSQADRKVGQHELSVQQSLADSQSEQELADAAVRRQQLTSQAASPRLVNAGDVSTTSPERDAAVEPRPVKITLLEGGRSVEVREVPAWVQDPERVDRDRDTERFVLRSGRYAEVEEAETELLERLAPRAVEYLARGGVGLAPEQLTVEEVRGGGVLTRRLHEQFEVEVGAFTQPVYRVTWEVSLRPSVRESLGAVQRIAERNRRLWELGGAFGLATLLLGTWAAYFRIDDATQGRYRRRLRVAAGTIAAAAALTGLLIA